MLIEQILGLLLSFQFKETIEHMEQLMPDNSALGKFHYLPKVQLLELNFFVNPFVKISTETKLTKANSVN